MIANRVVASEVGVIWIIRAARNYASITILIMSIYCLYLGLDPTPHSSFLDILGLLAFFVVATAAVVGGPTLALSWLVVRPGTGITSATMMRFMALLLIVWVPGVFIPFQPEVGFVVSAAGVQVIFALTLPMATRSVATK